MLQVEFCLCPMSWHGISLSHKHLICDSFIGVLQIWAENVMCEFYLNIARKKNMEWSYTVGPARVLNLAHKVN